MKLVRKQILQTAANYICADREADYGTPEENFTAIAKLWSCWLGMDISAHDVAILMALLKIGRMQTGAPKDDTYIDACGYLAIGAEIVLPKKTFPPIRDLTDFDEPLTQFSNVVVKEY